MDTICLWVGRIVLCACAFWCAEHLESWFLDNLFKACRLNRFVWRFAWHYKAFGAWYLDKVKAEREKKAQARAKRRESAPLTVVQRDEVEKGVDEALK